MDQNGLSNWGRWGPDDEKGTLNLLTPEVVLKAARLIKKGTVYSLAVPVYAGGPQNPMLQKTHMETDLSRFGESELYHAVDTLSLVSHAGTHVDSLGHFWWGGCFYNGFSEDQVSTEGLKKVGIENVRWMVGRGVMLDIPAYRGIDHMGPGDVVTVEDLNGAASVQGVAPEPGDIVLIRTGWYRLFDEDRALWETSFPGPDGSVVPWLAEHDICALGADTFAVEVWKSPSNPEGAPVHEYAIRDLGVYLIENLNLEELARDKVYEFMFIGAPLPLVGASGGPWNPLAIV